MDERPSQDQGLEAGSNKDEAPQAASAHTNIDDPVNKFAINQIKCRDSEMIEIKCQQPQDLQVKFRLAKMLEVKCHGSGALQVTCQSAEDVEILSQSAREIQDKEGVAAEREAEHPKYHDQHVPDVADVTASSSGSSISRRSHHPEEAPFDDIPLQIPPEMEHFGPTYFPIEDIEPMERYEAGGYYHMKIGDKFPPPRYEIVDKLGYGITCTAWLARDHKERRYVAIKALSADSTKASSEIDLLQALNPDKKALSELRGKEKLVLHLLDHFQTRGREIEGSRYLHQFLVIPLARCSIGMARDASGKKGMFQLDVARLIAAQLIQAVAFLHSHNIAHGDLHEGNVFLCLPESIDLLSIKQFHRKYRKPVKEKVWRSDKKPLACWIPQYGVYPAWLGADPIDITLSECMIALGDLSEGFNLEKTQRYQSTAPFTIRPPKTFFEPDRALGFHTDIWSLACTILSILGSGAFFGGGMGADRDRVIKQHVQLLGPLPAKWWSEWEARSKTFDTEGNRIDVVQRDSLEERFELEIQQERKNYNLEAFGDGEKSALLALLGSMLSYDPDSRPSANELLSSEWMTQWAFSKVM